MILASFTVLFSAGTVEAHSPSDVSIEYNMEEEELTVDITHSVGNPQSHYIYNVVVEVDGTEERNEEYEEQPDDTNFQYTYDLVVEPGSTIVATAYCNQGGSGSDTYEVEEEEETYDLSIDTQGNGSVTVEWNDHTEIVEDSDTFNIAEDTNVTLTAEADDGWQFLNWDIPEGHEDYIDEEDETITFPLHTDFSTTATFEEEVEEEDDDIPGFTTMILLLSVVIAVAVYYKKW